jgi:hypothetical protein
MATGPARTGARWRLSHDPQRWGTTAAKQPGHFWLKQSVSQSWSSTWSRSALIPQATAPVAALTAWVGPTGAVLAARNTVSGRWTRDGTLLELLGTDLVAHRHPPSGPREHPPSCSPCPSRLRASCDRRPRWTTRWRGGCWRKGIPRRLHGWQGPRPKWPGASRAWSLVTPHPVVCVLRRAAPALPAGAPRAGRGVGPVPCCQRTGCTLGATRSPQAVIGVAASLWSARVAERSGAERPRASTSICNSSPQAADELHQRLGRSPTTRELAEHLELGEEEALEGVAAVGSRLHRCRMQQPAFNPTHRPR